MIRVTRSTIIDAPVARVWAVLRDFNSHSAWHPAVGESQIENGEAADQVGCVRNFHLKDGNHIREQLLALSDQDYLSTYCIVDATLPMRRYVATVRLKPVTDGNRTFWHWQSTFEVPPGREAEFAELVGTGVYEGGFAGLRAYLRAGGAGADAGPGAGAGLDAGRRDAVLDAGLGTGASFGKPSAVAAALPRPEIVPVTGSPLDSFSRSDPAAGADFSSIAVVIRPPLGTRAETDGVSDDPIDAARRSR